MHMENKPQERIPNVVLLGSVDREGVLSAIAQSGRWYKRKDLHSSPDNWNATLEILNSPSVSAVLVQLTLQTYRHIDSSDYDVIGQALLSKIATLSHIVFVHEDLFSGTREGEFAEEIDYPIDEVRKSVNQLLGRLGINVFRYQKSSEITLVAIEFLSRTDTGLLLRLYVPHGQLWANETDRLLQLFRDYLTRIESIEVRLDQTSTKSGVIYELRGDPLGKIRVSNEFEAFSDFMTVCTKDLDQARLLLQAKSIKPGEIADILARYSKEARRLQVDLRQDREQKILQIRHRLESELIDTISNDSDIAAIGELVESIVPAALGPKSAIKLTVLGIPTSNSVTVNLNPQYVQTVHGIVAQTISGDVSLNDNDKELLQLFDKYGGQQKAELVTALRELKDESAPKAGRLTARQMIGKFLGIVIDKATDVGVGVLQAYVQKQLLGQ